MLWQSLSNQWAEVCGLDAEVCCFSSYMDHSNLFPRVCRLPTPLHFFSFSPISRNSESSFPHMEAFVHGWIFWWGFRGMVEAWFATMCQKKSWFLSEADWTTFHVAEAVSRKEMFPPLYPHFAICENKLMLKLLNMCEASKSRNAGLVYFSLYKSWCSLWA